MVVMIAYGLFVIIPVAEKFVTECNNEYGENNWETISYYNKSVSFFGTTERCVPINNSISLNSE
jgi:hypothetical protein